MHTSGDRSILRAHYRDNLTACNSKYETVTLKHVKIRYVIETAGGPVKGSTE